MGILRIYDLYELPFNFNNREPWNVFTNPESFYHIIPKIKKLKCSIGIAINRDNIRLLFKHVNYVEF